MKHTTYKPTELVEMSLANHRARQYSSSLRQRRYLVVLFTLILPLSVVMSTLMLLTAGCASSWVVCSPTPIRRDPKEDILDFAHQRLAQNESAMQGLPAGMSADVVTHVDPVVSDTSEWEWVRDIDCNKWSHFDDEQVVLDGCRVPILTMFTAMHDSDESRERIHNNTINNWASLGPCVQHVLFIEDVNSSVAQLATDHNWMVKNIPRTLHGIPVLKSMFLAAFSSTNTPLYIYANADILFDFTLVRTSSALLCSLLKRYSSPGSQAFPSEDRPTLTELLSIGIFAVGQRTNVMESAITSLDLKDITALSRGSNLFDAYAQDYFISSSHSKFRIKGPETETTSTAIGFSDKQTGLLAGKDKLDDRRNMRYFPWDEIPDFVIGRIGYDNWLVAQAIKWNVTWAIDVTNTVHAIHQTGLYGIRSGRDAPDHWKTLWVNHEMIKKDYYFRAGQTFCMPWMSVIGIDKRVAFIPRDSVKVACKTPRNYKAKWLNTLRAKHQKKLLAEEAQMKQSLWPVKTKITTERHYVSSTVSPIKELKKVFIRHRKQYPDSLNVTNYSYNRPAYMPVIPLRAKNIPASAP